MKTYATLGPACCRAELLTDLLGLGLTGFRLNLSHTTLAACRPWTDAVQAARQASGRDAELIIDMRGPELRMGPLPRPVTLTAGERVTLGPGGLPVEPDILAAIRPGREILLDDGLMALHTKGLVQSAYSFSFTAPSDRMKNLGVAAASVFLRIA